MCGNLTHNLHSDERVDEGSKRKTACESGNFIGDSGRNGFSDRFITIFRRSMFAKYARRDIGVATKNSVVVQRRNLPQSPIMASFTHGRWVIGPSPLPLAFAWQVCTRHLFLRGDLNFSSIAFEPQSPVRHEFGEISGKEAGENIMTTLIVHCPNAACGRVSHLGVDPLGRIFRCPRCLTKLPSAPATAADSRGRLC